MVGHHLIQNVVHDHWQSILPCTEHFNILSTTLSIDLLPTSPNIYSRLIDTPSPIVINPRINCIVLHQFHQLNDHLHVQQHVHLNIQLCCVHKLPWTCPLTCCTLECSTATTTIRSAHHRLWTCQQVYWVIFLTNNMPNQVVAHLQPDPQVTMFQPD